MWLSVLALAIVCEAHVRLIHKPYFTLPIRNAPTPSSDGTLSTAGPCGGVQSWGNKSFTTVTVGQNLSLVFAYNGGHQSPTMNMLRVAMICGKPMSDALLKNTTVAPTFSPLVNASDSSTKGYDLWVIIPSIQPGTNGEFCTISALDVRNWGGCVDVKVVAAAMTPTPATAAQNALTGKSVAGTYTFGQSQCTPDSPNCCCLSGTLTVTHDAGATSATGSAVLNTCNANGTLVTVNTTLPVTLTQQAPTLASLKATVLAMSYSISFQVIAGTKNSLIMTDDSSAPHFCGLDSSLYVASGANPTPANGGGGDTSSGAQIVFSGVAVLLTALLAY